MAKTNETCKAAAKAAGVHDSLLQWAGLSKDEMVLVAAQEVGVNSIVGEAYTERETFFAYAEQREVRPWVRMSAKDRFRDAYSHLRWVQRAAFEAADAQMGLGYY